MKGMAVMYLIGLPARIVGSILIHRHDAKVAEESNKEPVFQYNIDAMEMDKV